MRWTVSRASAQLLQEVSKVLRDEVLQSTLEFAGPKLNSQSWQDNHVGMITLGSVMEGPSSEALQRNLAPAYATIFQMWDSSPSSRVRQSTAWLIA